MHIDCHRLLDADLIKHNEVAAQLPSPRSQVCKAQRQCKSHSSSLATAQLPDGALLQTSLSLYMHCLHTKHRQTLRTQHRQTWTTCSMTAPTLVKLANRLKNLKFDAICTASVHDLHHDQPCSALQHNSALQIAASLAVDEQFYSTLTAAALQPLQNLTSARIAVLSCHNRLLN